jgi:hypothetical protein
VASKEVQGLLSKEVTCGPVLLPLELNWRVSDKVGREGGRRGGEAENREQGREVYKHWGLPAGVGADAP